MKFQEFDFEKGLIDEKTYENVLIYNNSCRTLIDPKPLRIRFDKIVGFFGFYNESWYLILFGPGNSDALCIRIRYISITYVTCYKYARIKVDSYDPLPLDKMLTLHNIMILIKSVFNEDQKHLFFNMFFKKCSYQLAKR